MDITQIVVAIIGLISLILTGLIIPYIKSKTTAQQQETLLTIAKISVYAAQQLFTDNYDKKKFASYYADTMLEKAGLKVDGEIVSAAIESELKKAKMENPKWKG